MTAPMKLVTTTPVTRTYDYEGRLPDPASMLKVSGLEYLQGVLRGDFPAAPIASTLGLWPSEFSHGRAVFVGMPERFTYNPLGTVHGGWAATILDSAMGCAVHTTLPAGRGYTTIDLSVSLVRAITERAKTLMCEAKIIHAGGSVATAEGRVTDEAGTLYATGTTTCLILTPR